MIKRQYSFAELVDVDEIRPVIQGFYTFTGIPPSLTDTQGKVLLAVGWQRICSDFHRKHDLTRQRCVESDTKLAAMLDMSKGYSCYKCLNGLIDVAMPIVIEGAHLANLFTGQFFFTPPDKEYFRRQAREMGFDEVDYLAAVDEVPIFTRERVEGAVRFLGCLAELIAGMGLKQLRLVELNEDLERTVERRTDRLRKEVEVRKRAELELETALAEYETVFANSSVGIVHLKGGRRIHRVNRRFLQIFGYDSPEEVRGQSALVLHLSQRNYESFGKEYYNPLARSDVIHVEYQLRHRNGRAIWCSLYGKAVNPPHMEQGVIWVIEDISSRKELESLREDMEMITRHDLKAPLSGIVSMARVLLQNEELDTEQCEALSLIESTGVRMHTQINHSLDLFRMESGEYEFRPESVDLEKLVQRVADEFEVKSKSLEVSIEVGLRTKDGRPVTALAEEMLTYSLLANLLTNALEASSSGDVVRVELNRDHGRCLVSVSNSGVVPDHIQGTFFSKYVTSGKSGGTGMGTYSARLMTEIQGGTITMASKSGHGTTIMVNLPGAYENEYTRSVE